MSQSNLIELTYYDPNAGVRLMAYADTIITDSVGRDRLIAAIRFGGYPEVVQALPDALYGGAAIDAIQNNTTQRLQSIPKRYQRQLSYDLHYSDLFETPCGLLVQGNRFNYYYTPVKSNAGVYSLLAEERS